MSQLYTNLLYSTAVLLLGIIITAVISYTSKILIGRIIKKTKSETDDYIFNVVLKAFKPLGVIISFDFSWNILGFEGRINNFVEGIVKLIILFILVRVTNKIIIKLLARFSEKINDEAVGTMLESLQPMVRSSIWALGIVLFLQNMGVQMAAIWALLSAGGIGAGLALKEPVQEFFEYITILLDKPFQKGQFINVDNVWASVERVGVRSTRLRSLNGEIIIMSNSLLTKGIISNYGEMIERRIVHKLGVVYNTSQENLEKIPRIIEEIINKAKYSRFDRCHFVDFGDFSLNFEVVYYIKTNNYKIAMDSQQFINLSIFDAFANEGIDFAFPTSTINLVKES